MWEERTATSTYSAEAELTDSPRISPDLETGQAISKLQFFTKANPVPATPQETLDSEILRSDSKVSPRTVSAGEWPLPKRGGRLSLTSRETDLPRNLDPLT
jgi:hypothetical protein